MLRQGQFFSLSNRRNAALQMFQALRRNTVFWTSCVVYDENHPKFSADRSVTTVNQGLGVEPNAEWAHASEATHRGTPMWSAARTAAVKLALVTSAFGVFPSVVRNDRVVRTLLYIEHSPLGRLPATFQWPRRISK